MLAQHIWKSVTSGWFPRDISKPSWTCVISFAKMAEQSRLTENIPVFPEDYGNSDHSSTMLILTNYAKSWGNIAKMFATRITFHPIRDKTKFCIGFERKRIKLSGQFSSFSRTRTELLGSCKRIKEVGEKNTATGIKICESSGLKKASWRLQDIKGIEVG